jgi:hypothetical protein
MFLLEREKLIVFPEHYQHPQEYNLGSVRERSEMIDTLFDIAAR